MNFKILVYLVLLLLFVEDKATACSCSRGARLVKDEVKRSTLVLVGKVLSVEEVRIKIEDSGNKVNQRAYFNKVTFLVTRLFKGKKKGQKVVIYTGLGKGDCGFFFKLGRRYVLYGNKSASPFWRDKVAPPKGLEEAYWTDICTRTQGLDSKEVLALRKVRRANSLARKKQ